MGLWVRMLTSRTNHPLTFLLGYRNIIEKGYQHRDISIGNILFLKDGRRTIQPIEETMGDCPSLSSNHYRRRLALLVKRYPTFAKCHGYVIDGDMAIELKLHFENKEYLGSRSVYWFYFFLPRL